MLKENCFLLNSDIKTRDAETGEKIMDGYTDRCFDTGSEQNVLVVPTPASDLVRGPTPGGVLVVGWEGGPTVANEGSVANLILVNRIRSGCGRSIA